MLDAVNYSEARQNLASLMDSISASNDVVVITRRKAKPVVMLSLADYNSMMETNYLLRNPANAKRLMDSIAEYEEGKLVYHSLSELEKMQ